ncbi:site-specific integrase [Chromobacterium sp. IRSSSOUMB001]|uniref:site-specific integrase n=1 Tax=Chromobacterium sp. IRSSSOUMB001 TaxID=2927123 RepID=UPI0020BDD682|nr:site-specific integrase [Chromobacterium sp. IRSSSOUMB001]
MSLSQPLPFQLIRALLPNGERRSFLVDQHGMEDDYSSLFVISTIRNPGLSVASQEAALNAVNVFRGFCCLHQIDLVERFIGGKYLTFVECESLSNFARQSFGVEAKRLQKVVELGKVRRGYSYSAPSVAGPTHFKRLTHIADFAEWMAKYLLTHVSQERMGSIAEMRAQILRHRGLATQRKDDVGGVEFTRRHNQVLNELIAPGAERNPFRPDLQLRNLLLVELLRQTGMRRGEVLSLQVRDVDHVKRQVTIRRRHDEKDDPRIDQPVAKTEGRTIPISIYLTELLVWYVSQRRTVPGATKHRYLFVTHKSGPTQGQPMTKAALKEVFDTLADADERIAQVRSHLLRHFFSSELAKLQHEQGSDGNSKELHRRVRNYLAGRKQYSEVDAVYTKLETKRQAREATLELQDRMTADLPLKRKPT